MTAAVMHRLSMAIEAIEQCRKEITRTCSGRPEVVGAASASASFSAIRAQSLIEVALNEMVEATKGEEGEAAE
jgi:hypothetical protein